MLKSIVKRRGDVAFLSGGESRVFYPSVRTDGQLEKVMQHLAVVQPNVVSPMESLLPNERQLNNSILILITGQVTDELKAFLLTSSKYARAVICFVVVSKEQYKQQQQGSTAKFANAKMVYVTKEMFSQAFAEVNKP